MSCSFDRLNIRIFCSFLFISCIPQLETHALAAALDFAAPFGAAFGAAFAFGAVAAFGAAPFGIALAFA